MQSAMRMGSSINHGNMKGRRDTPKLHITISALFSVYKMVLTLRGEGLKMSKNCPNGLSMTSFTATAYEEEYETQFRCQIAIIYLINVVTGSPR